MPCKCLSREVLLSIARTACAGEPYSAFSVHLRKEEDGLDALQVPLAGGAALHSSHRLRR